MNARLPTLALFLLTGLLTAHAQPDYTVPRPRTSITRIEWFIDTDPGFGNGTPVTITPTTDFNGLQTNIPLTGVTPGTHTLYVRSQNANGSWSLTNNTVFHN